MKHICTNEATEINKVLWMWLSIEHSSLGGQAWLLNGTDRSIKLSQCFDKWILRKGYYIYGLSSGTIYAIWENNVQISGMKY